MITYWKQSQNEVTEQTKVNHGDTQWCAVRLALKVHHAA
jgi:hypothetical protein